MPAAAHSAAIEQHAALPRAQPLPIRSPPSTGPVLRRRPRRPAGRPSRAAQRRAARAPSARSGGRSPRSTAPVPRRRPAGRETGRAGRGSPSGAAQEPAAKEKHKEAREDGEAEPAAEKQKEKQQQQGKEEAVAKSVGQQFFKIFIPDQSGERLKIPVSFHQHLKEQPIGLVFMKGPSGNTWQATLTSDSEGLCFGQGWKEFVTDHSIKLGHLLVFTYDGLSRFSVTVFSSSGVVDPPALVAKPANYVVVKIEDDEEVHEVMDVGGPSETPILPPDDGPSETPVLPTELEEGNRATRKRTRGGDDLILADGSASKRRSSFTKNAEKKRSEAIAGKVRPQAIASTSKDASKIINTEKERKISLLDESTTYNKTQVRDKNIPKFGKFIVKKVRQPVVISQRRPVTQEEKDLALKRAQEFKSKNPFAVQIMMESYVYVGFFMNITCDFVREALPRTSKKMTLWDPLGKSWEVNYVYYSDRSVASFSGGWGKFAVGNNLEKFDVCIFELFKEDNIKVHIYRVVPEITPLLRASSKD